MATNTTFKYTIFDVGEMLFVGMNLELIEDLWDEDSKIDNDELALRVHKGIPSLHSKYYKIYNNILRPQRKDKKISSRVLQERQVGVLLW